MVLFCSRKQYGSLLELQTLRKGMLLVIPVEAGFEPILIEVWKRDFEACIKI